MLRRGFQPSHLGAALVAMICLVFGVWILLFDDLFSVIFRQPTQASQQFLATIKELSCSDIVWFLVSWKEIDSEFLVNWRVVQFFNFLERYDGESLINWKEIKESGVLRCSSMREMQLKKNCRERRNCTRVIIDCRERRNLGASMLWCFARRRQFRVSCRFDLEREITSLFIFSNPCK